MPTYEYACKTCGEHLEVVQSFKDDPLTECAVCGGQLRKVFGSIGIAFKGSGFYRTDSRTSSSAGSSSSSGGDSSSKSDSGKSESGKSESGKSESGKSDSGKSESGKSDSGKSDSKSSGAGSKSTPGSAAAAS
jgi:putative FmdB family regulatory protein